MKRLLLIVILLMGSCATKVMAPEPDSPKWYMLPHIHDHDGYCVQPENGPMLSECLSPKQFHGCATSVKAN